MTDVSTFPAVTALVIFCLAIILTLFLVFKAVALRIPVSGRKPFTINVKYYIAPVIAVLAMLACTSMSIADVGRGLLGNDQIKPYGILVLFMSMAYIAASLDASGVFAWLALKFTAMSGGRGRVLFLFYFLLSSFITTFTSNDVCILTLTPIVCYFAKATGVDPMPFLFAEYAAANTFGALLYTGNPTNIIVAQAYDMTFLGYSKYMTLPTLAGGVACFAMLFLEFHSTIPVSIPLPSVDATHMLRDRLGAVIGSINMLACLGILAAAPSLGWEMWAITLVCAGIHCVYNIWAFRKSLLQVPFMECWTCGCERLDTGAAEAAVAVDGCSRGGGGHGSSEMVAPAPVRCLDDTAGSNTVAGKAGQEKAVVRGRAQLSNLDSALGDATATESGLGIATPARTDSGCSGSGSSSEGRAGHRRRAAAPSGRGSTVSQPGPVAEAAADDTETDVGVGSLPVMSLVLAEEDLAQRQGPSLGGVDAAVDSAAGVAAAAPPVITAASLCGKAPTFWALLFDLPWEVVPFALGMFVLVEGLYVQGWLTVFGSGLGDASQTLPAAIFIMGFLSVFLANTINNQPMTILLTRVALDSKYMAFVGHGNTHKAALFALVLGSNIGAVFTVIGALAGILWSNIIGIHGLSCTYARFARVCVPVGSVTLVASLLVLWFEFAVFPHTD